MQLNHPFACFESTSATETQVYLEKTHAKYDLMPALREEFIAQGFEKDCKDAGLPLKFGIDLLCQAWVHIAAPMRIFISLLHKHFQEEENPIQACADAIGLAIDGKLVELEIRTNSEGEEIDYLACCNDINKEPKELIDQLQFPLPMIVKPAEVRANHHTGYLSLRGSLLMKNNHHENDICHDAINRANAVPLALNTDIVAFVQNKWKNLDKRKPDETLEDFQKRVKAFEHYDRRSRDVIQFMLAQGNEFYLTHRYDKRGRMYSTGYHINYQGNDWNKACIEFANKEVTRCE